MGLDQHLSSFSQEELQDFKKINKVFAIGSAGASMYYLTRVALGESTLYHNQGIAYYEALNRIESQPFEINEAMARIEYHIAQYLFQESQDRNLSSQDREFIENNLVRAEQLWTQRIEKLIPLLEERYDIVKQYKWPGYISQRDAAYDGGFAGLTLLGALAFSFMASKAKQIFHKNFYTPPTIK